MLCFDALLSCSASQSSELPTLHGRSAERSESTPSPGHRCSARLRYLSYRAVDLDALLREFDQAASVIYSGWHFKPNAERDVIKSRGDNDSILQRRVIKGKLPPLNQGQKHSLLVCLDNILEEPYQESRLSDSLRFERPTTEREANASRSPSTQSTSTMLRGRVTKPAERPSTPAKKPPSKTTRSAKRQNDVLDGQENHSKKSKTLLDLGFGRDRPAGSNSTGDGALPSDADDEDLMPDVKRSFSGSNDTVPTSDATGASFYSTQELDDVFDDPSVKRSIDTVDSGYESGPSSALHSRLARTIDAKAIAVPAGNMTYEFVYELQTLALLWSVPAKVVRMEVIEFCKTDTPALEQRLAAYQCIAAGRPYDGFTLSSWDAGAGLPEERKSHRSVYQEATLSWAQSNSPVSSPFDIRLNAPRTQRSCRFHRIFDGRRFLTLNIPGFKGTNLPGASEDELYEAVSQWLCDGFQIAQRHWMPFLGGSASFCQHRTWT